MNAPFDKDLTKVLGYEVNYLKERHSKILKLSQELMIQSKGIEEDLTVLTHTLEKLSKGEDWRDTPPHPRLKWLRCFS